MFFSTPHDTASKAVTAIVFVLLISTAIALHNFVVTGLFALLLIAAFAWSPTAYAIADGSIIVRRFFGNVRIPLDGTRDVRVATPHDLSGCLRLFASGGLFGHYGAFRTAGLGKCTWYVTDRSHPIVLVAASGTYLFSPGDSAAFIEAVRREKSASGVGQA